MENQHQITLHGHKRKDFEQGESSQARRDDASKEMQIPSCIFAPSVPLSKEALAILCPILQDRKTYSEKYANRNLVNPAYIDLPYFMNENFSFIHNLDQAGLLNFLMIIDNVYPVLTQAFFATFHFNTHSSIATARVKGQEIVITPSVWFDITGLTWDGPIFGTCSNRYPTVYESTYTLEIGKAANCHCQARDMLDSKIRVGELTTTSRLLHYILTKIILPRRTNVTYVTHSDMFILWVLLKNKPLNWSYLVLRYWSTIVEKGTSDLPSAMVVTRILRYSGVSFEGEICYAPEEWWKFGSSTIQKSGIVQKNGEWITRLNGARSNISLEDVVASRLYQNPNPSHISSIYHSLDQLQEQINEVHAALQESIESHVSSLYESVSKLINDRFDSLHTALFLPILTPNPPPPAYDTPQPAATVTPSDSTILQSFEPAEAAPDVPFSPSQFLLSSPTRDSDHPVP